MVLLVVLYIFSIGILIGALIIDYDLRKEKSIAIKLQYVTYSFLAIVVMLVPFLNLALAIILFVNIAQETKKVEKEKIKEENFTINKVEAEFESIKKTPDNFLKFFGFFTERGVWRELDVSERKKFEHAKKKMLDAFDKSLCMLSSFEKTEITSEIQMNFSGMDNVVMMQPEDFEIQRKLTIHKAINKMIFFAELIEEKTTIKN